MVVTISVQAVTLTVSLGIKFSYLFYVKGMLVMGVPLVIPPASRTGNSGQRSAQGLDLTACVPHFKNSTQPAPALRADMPRQAAKKIRAGGGDYVDDHAFVTPSNSLFCVRFRVRSAIVAGNAA